jgi:ribosomal 30S subunit maturation factor RimM
VLSYPANDVIVLDYKEKEILIPAVDEFIKLIDFEKKCLTINVIDGLLDG